MRGILLGNIKRDSVLFHARPEASRLQPASPSWCDEVQQHDLECNIAFIRQFYTLYSGLVDSNKKNKNAVFI